MCPVAKRWTDSIRFPLSGGRTRTQQETTAGKGGSELKDHSIQRSWGDHDGGVHTEVMRTQGSKVVWLMGRKTWSRQPEKLRYQEEVERSQALKLPQFSLLSGSNSSSPFLKSLAKIDRNFFYLQFNSPLFAFKSLDAYFLSLPWWRGEAATADERSLRGQANTRILKASSILSWTSNACWVQCTGHGIKS